MLASICSRGMPRLIRSIARRPTTRSACLSLSFAGSSICTLSSRYLLTCSRMRLLHVVVDALDHLLAEGVAQFLLVCKTEAVEEILVDLGQLQLLDVLERDFDLHVLAADLLVGMRVGGLGVDGAGLAGLEAFELLVEVVDLDAGDAARAGDDLRVVGVG